MDKKEVLVFAGVILAFSLFVFAGAAGVATPYWKNNPLLLSPGESNTVYLSLQNTGDEGMVLNASITSSEGIASLKKTLYEVGAGEVDVPVEIKVSVPKDSQIGSEYTVSISFKQISDESGEMLQVAAGFTTSFPVKVVSTEESVLYGNKSEMGSIYDWIVIIAIVIALVLVFVFVRFRRKKKSSKKFK